MFPRDKPKIYKRIGSLLLSALPGLAVFGVVFSATVYHNLDSGRVVTEDNKEFQGQVGINTGAVPSGINLAVQGQAYISDRLGVGTSSPSSILDVFSAGSSASSLFRVATGTTEALFVDKAGNVGIGTTNPASRLTITGLDNTSSNSGLNVTNASSTSLLFVRNDGNVGIGTSSPASKLSVSGGAAIGSSYAGIAAPSNGLIVEGNVGIGTTSPTQALSVSGSQYLTGGIGVNDTNVTAGVVNVATGFRIANAATSNAVLRGNGTNFVSSAAAALTKTDDTNVTLTLGGTPSTALLDAVSLTLGWTGQLSVSRGGTGASSFTTGSVIFSDGTKLTQNNNNLFWDNTNIRLGIGTSSPAGLLHVATGTVDALVVDPVTGNVGIGTKAPTGKLDLVVTGGPTDFGAYTYSGTNWHAPRFRFNRARGTFTSPSAVINGDEVTDMTFRAYQNGAFQIASEIRVVVDGTPSGNNVPASIFFQTNNGSALGDRMVIKSSGNVSIGTTTPNHLLTVGKMSDATSTFAVGVYGSIRATGALFGITTTNNLAIGNRSGATDRTFDGLIDDVRIYNRVLSVNEIQRLYLLGVGTTILK